MTAAVITALLICAFLICAVSGAALLVMPGFYDKLHYLAPPAVLATSAVAAAIIIREGLGKAGIKTLLVLLVMVISNPVVTHAAARAKRTRDMRGPRIKSHHSGM